MSLSLSIQSPGIGDESLADLVQGDRVHRDVYVSERIFLLEQERLWKRAWVFVGHASLVPKAGDFYTTEIAGQSLVMLRQPDGKVTVLYNRCAHKGSRIVHDRRGNAGKFLRCPYHAWTYKLDGKLMSVPL
jgi:phenylpropionate dioxygenase-like ring-hydroxylating dioxygenase large terminal subunit